MKRRNEPPYVTSIKKGITGIISGLFEFYIHYPLSIFEKSRGKSTISVLTSFRSITQQVFLNLGDHLARNHNENLTKSSCHQKSGCRVYARICSKNKSRKITYYRSK